MFTARYELNVEIIHVHLGLKTVPWLRLLVAGLSPLKPGFDSESVHVGFVVDKVALGQDSLSQYHSTNAPNSF